MRKSNSGCAGQAIERVLEFSADAQIVRCKTAKDSPAFHRLTGAIAAYAKVLAILTALQQREEFLTVVAQSELPKPVAEGKSTQVQRGINLAAQEDTVCKLFGVSKPAFINDLDVTR
jgi:hypothetical protein